jgi:hypothetical protein
MPSREKPGRSRAEAATKAETASRSRSSLHCTGVDWQRSVRPAQFNLSVSHELPARRECSTDPLASFYRLPGPRPVQPASLRRRRPSQHPVAELRVQVLPNWRSNRETPARSTSVSRQPKGRSQSLELARSPRRRPSRKRVSSAHPLSVLRDR